MPKKYYQILEISETATQEEIKKAYRKLATKWHPDKWVTKSLQEREEANKKMQKINRAYEILSDEEKRKRYNLGETDFSAENSSYYEEAAREAKEEELKRKEELLEKIVKGTEEYIRIMEEIWLLGAIHLDRSETALEISSAFNFSFPRVFWDDLDSNLWQPYQDWNEKVWKMPITISRDKRKSEELKNFKEQILKAIEEARFARETRENAEEKEWSDRADSRFKKEKAEEIEAIEELLKRKGLKAEDLGEYSNYQEQINNLDKLWKIHDLRDEIIENIWELVKKKGQDNSEFTAKNKQDGKETEGQIPSNFDNTNQKINYGNLTQKELVNIINQKERFRK